jgi:hypothetical protein
MQRSRPLGSRRVFSLCLVCALLLASGCSRIVGHYTQPLFDDLTSSFMQQRDVVIAEQGTPSFLLILDGLITHSPDNPSLLLAGAKAYSSYNTAFVGSRFPERNKILAAKAKDYAIRALCLHSRKFDEVKDANLDAFTSCLPSFQKEDVPFLFYAATSWAGWITANSSSWDAIAELPKVQSLIERVIELDEGFYYGTPDAFMGVLLTIRPPALGGKPEEAKRFFEKAIELGQGKFLPTYVMFAKSYAKLVYDEELFFSLLNQVLESPVDPEPNLILINTLAQQQARELIDEARKDEYFD